MDSGIFFGGSVVAAVVAGTIALFAPCCISVMLPAYFATSFQNRRLLVAMTFLFAAGVATVILPIAMGAAVVRRLITDEHTTIYVTGGLLMLGLATYLLLGGQIHLPMPGRRTGGRTGPLSVYSLGIFSGVASACCAPVLAGVIALSGVASSFGLALGLGAAYVFGMVAPLFAISLLWERFNWRSSRLFRSRSFTWRVGAFQRTLGVTDLASGLLLALMGVAMVWIGLTSDGMPASSGWQVRLSARLQHYGRVITDALAWLPGWASVALLALVLILLAGRALKQVGWIGRASEETDEVSASAEIGPDARTIARADTLAETTREILEHQHS
ncbi:MAG: cytochrome c biogenesis protein CcdA [Chloroflexota bacterium]|nr:cytochrome c biogenesis protein CcdA [Chloroflexota bacterium]